MLLQSRWHTTITRLHVNTHCFRTDVEKGMKLCTAVQEGCGYKDTLRTHCYFALSAKYFIVCITYQPPLVVNYFTAISLFCSIIPQAHSCSWSLHVFENSIMVETGPLHVHQFTNSHFHIPLLYNWLPSWCSYSDPNDLLQGVILQRNPTQLMSDIRVVVISFTGNFCPIDWAAKTTVGRLLIPQY